MKLDNILYGGDYNPEQWLNQKDILEQDIEYMKRAGINTVSLGIFAWSMLEKQEGVYDFSWLRERIDKLYENGISTILATPSGARPKWLADKYNEVLRVDRSRKRQLFGGRHNHCYTSPIYRKKVFNINTALAKEFGNDEAVILWHISNEYGGECHCPLCQDAFREWLYNRYKDINELNEAWCTAFWSHRYDTFEQIESPSDIGETGIHALNLEWKRFVTEQTKDFIEHEIKAIRQYSDKPTTINMMYNYLGLDYSKLADSVDIISWDSYPVWHKKSDIKTAFDNSFWHDYMRSLKRKPFLLMESSPSATNWQGVSKLKRPGLLTSASLQAIAHGSDSVMYFQIRKSRGGFEKFHGAVIDHSLSDDTRVFKEVKSIGESLCSLREIIGTQTKSDIAIICDTESRWALDDSMGPRNDGIYQYESMQKSYRALKMQGINIDIIEQTADFSPYKLIVAPVLYMFKDGVYDKIRKYVSKGGCFVFSYFSGIVDKYDRCYLGKVPYGLEEVFGLYKEETDSLYDNTYNIVEAEDFLKKSYSCDKLCDLLIVEGAEILGKYTKDFYKGSPALTKNKYLSGLAYYIAADMEEDFYIDFYKRLIDELDIPRICKGDIPENIEVSTRVGKEYEYIFVHNFSDNTVDISSMQLSAELLYGNNESILNEYKTNIYKRRL